MRLAHSLLLICCVLAGAGPSRAFSQAPTLPTGAAHYNLLEADNGRTVGTADCNVQTLPNGYQVNSHGDLKMTKLTYSFSNENRLDSQLNIVREQLSGTVNGSQVTFSLTSDASGRQFQVNITAQGKNTTNAFDRHQHTILLPDLDPAAYVEMAHMAMEHSPTAWIVIPKQNGLLVPANYTAQPDVRGTFHGQPIDAHHTSVVVSEQNGISVEIYYTSEGALLEADLPEQNFYVIRDEFKLQNRPHYTPPHSEAPSPNQPGQPESQQPPQQNAYPQPEPQ